MNKKTLIKISFFGLISFLISNIDIILGINYIQLGDRINYLASVKDGFQTTFNSIFSIINLEFGWESLLALIKIITFTENNNFVLRIVTFISSLIFLLAFNIRTKSLFTPIFLILLPGVFEFYVVKIRHGLAISMFAYIISIEYYKLRNLFYLIILTIHNSFLITIPVYLSGIKLSAIEFKKEIKLLLNSIYFGFGCLTGFVILELMNIFGIRQFGYLSRAAEILPPSGEGTGAYRLAIFIVTICLCIIKVTYYDSNAILYSSSYFLGISVTSALGGRLLSTLLPFLVADLLTSKSQKNILVYWFIRILISLIFIIGWYASLSQEGFGLY